MDAIWQDSCIEINENGADHVWLVMPNYNNLYTHIYTQVSCIYVDVHLHSPVHDIIVIRILYIYIYIFLSH